MQVPECKVFGLRSVRPLSLISYSLQEPCQFSSFSRKSFMFTGWFFRLI
jgi:hypothetical protein